eukprot:TRINITY_DN8049_c0_g2_i2.p1 TRINITY_DN8049_c0_g2~~TRINITY_DN8049_c0_g2_i2.p1  ORF type:complete len:417 (-),score=85.31 TRINITY_DN8049_c0_g2_i2:719-1969(-)
MGFWPFGSASAVDPADQPDPADKARPGDAEAARGANLTDGFVEFYRGVIGKSHVFAHFETSAEFSTTDNRFLRRVPLSAASNDAGSEALLRATVWGDCIGAATIEFTVDATTLRYFRDGVQGEWWRPLKNTRLVSGRCHLLPSMIWTGLGQNRGWILSNGPYAPLKATFASSYGLNDDYDRCKGRPLQGGERVSLWYRERAVETDAAVPAGVAQEGGGAPQSVAWVSVDPRSGQLVAYPLEIAGRLEAAWGTGKQATVDLAPLIQGAQVHLRLGGRQPFQRTERGRRDVRRVPAEGSVASGEAFLRLRVAHGVAGWYVADSDAETAALASGGAPEERRMAVTEAMLTRAAGSRSSAEAKAEDDLEFDVEVVPERIAGSPRGGASAGATYGGGSAAASSSDAPPAAAAAAAGSGGGG